MRARVRASSLPGRRERSVPARSRMTVRRSEAPFVRGNQLAFIAVIFFYAPAVAARAGGRRFDYHEAGLRLHPAGLNLKVLGGACLLAFPAFVAGFFLFYEYACGAAGT